MRAINQIDPLLPAGITEYGRDGLFSGRAVFRLDFDCFGLMVVVLSRAALPLATSGPVGISGVHSSGAPLNPPTTLGALGAIPPGSLPCPIPGRIVITPAFETDPGPYRGRATKLLGA
jgi:hypothetical protein